MKSTVPNIMPWLTVSNVDQAISFYQVAFNATASDELRNDAEEAEVAQIHIGESAFWIQRMDSARNDEDEAPVRFMLEVEVPDKAYAQSIEAGASQKTELHEEYGWYSGRVIDPFGYDWEICQRRP